MNKKYIVNGHMEMTTEEIIDMVMLLLREDDTSEIIFSYFEGDEIKVVTSRDKDIVQDCVCEKVTDCEKVAVDFIGQRTYIEIQLTSRINCGHSIAINSRNDYHAKMWNHAWSWGDFY